MAHYQPDYASTCCCQTETNSPRSEQAPRVPGGAERPPFSEGGSPGPLVAVAGAGGPFSVELASHQRADGGDLLGAYDAPEAQPRPSSPSERLVEILDLVVPLAAGDLLVLGPNVLKRSVPPSRAHRLAPAASCKLQEPRRGVLAALLGDRGLEHLTHEYCAPELVPDSVDPDERPLEVATPAERAHPDGPFPPDLGHEHRAEAHPQEPHCPRAHLDVSLA